MAPHHRLPPALRAKVKEREAALVHAADVELGREEQLRRRDVIAGAQRLVAQFTISGG
eukprot:SAG25_NODE_3108_length_1214_cov_1.748879_2_plen_58_part_00